MPRQRPQSRPEAFHFLFAVPEREKLNAELRSAQVQSFPKHAVILQGYEHAQIYHDDLQFVQAEGTSSVPSARDAGLFVTGQD
jgi:hypothetical protein